MFVKGETNSKGRPKSTMPTESRTYTYYTEDLEYARDKDIQPKHVFRMGILAIKGNPELISRVGESESQLKTLSERVFRMSKMLDEQCKANYALTEKLSKLGVKIDDM